MRLAQELSFCELNSLTKSHSLSAANFHASENDREKEQELACLISEAVLQNSEPVSVSETQIWQMIKSLHHLRSSEKQN